MKVHHLSCGSFCLGAIPLLLPQGLDLCCHCLLIESEAGLVLVDTGFSTKDLASPILRLGITAKVLGVQTDPEITAVHQLKKMGFKAKDVRNIVVTHLDPDHVGGIQDFPQAKVHLYRKEYMVAVEDIRQRRMSARRFRDVQWRNWKNWEFYEDDEGENWQGFGAVHPLRGLKDLALLPLLGHSGGHCGVAVEGTRKLLHAGDSYYNRGELDFGKDPNPIEGAVAGRLAYDNTQRLQSLERLRKLGENPELTIFSSHDHHELDLLKNVR